MMDRFVLKFVELLGMLAIVGPRISVALVVPTLQSQCEKAGYQVACMDSTCKMLVCGKYNMYMNKYVVSGHIPMLSGSVCDRHKVCLEDECREVKPYMNFAYVGDTTVHACSPTSLACAEDDVFSYDDPSHRTLVNTPDAQCKNLGYSVACRYRNDDDWAEFGCEQLLCGIEVERGVYYHMYDQKVPEEGTRCGRNRACIGGKCTLIRATLPYIYVGDTHLSECSSDLQLAIINDQRQRESCDETIELHPTAVMVRTLNEQCLSLNYAAACKSKHLLGNTACTTIRCGEPAGTHLYNLVEIPQPAEDGTFCGRSHVCNQGKCVAAMGERFMYDGFLHFVECVDRPESPRQLASLPPSRPPTQPPTRPPTRPPTQPSTPRPIFQQHSPMLSPILHIQVHTLHTQCEVLGYDVACLSPNLDVDICQSLLCGATLAHNYHMLNILDFRPREGSPCGPGSVCKNRMCVPILSWEKYHIVGNPNLEECISPQVPVDLGHSVLDCL